MSVLTRFLHRTHVPAPADMTAALEPLFTDGGRDGCGVALTGYPEFLGVQADGDDIRYVRLRIGFGPDAHVIVRTPSAGYCAQAAEAWIKAYDALDPVPSEMEVKR